MQEFLNPRTLPTMVTNALQAAQAGSHGCGNNNVGSRQGKPFLARPQELSFQLRRMGPLMLRRLAITAKIQA